MYLKTWVKRVTPIHFASAYGYAQVVETLINHGADVNAQTHSLETPLHLAARRAHFDVVKMLLNHGANPNKTTKKGHSPLHYSVTATSTYDDIDETSVITGLSYFRFFFNVKVPIKLYGQKCLTLMLSSCHYPELDRIWAEFNFNYQSQGPSTTSSCNKEKRIRPGHKYPWKVKSRRYVVFWTSETNQL